MSIENSSFPELLQEPNNKTEGILKGPDIKNQAINYISVLENQGCNKEHINSTIQGMNELFLQQDTEIEKCNMKFLNLKENVNIELKNEKIKIKNELINKYSSEYKMLEGDIITFIDKAFSNDFNNELKDFNINNFDNKDKINGLSNYELQAYSQILDKAIKQMNLLGSYNKFKEQNNDENKYHDMFILGTADVFVANKIEETQDYFLGEEELKFTDSFHDMSEEEIHNMKEERFSYDSIGNLVKLLGLELGDGVQDIIKFLFNIPIGIALLPRYISNRNELSDGLVDTQQEAIIEIEQDELLKENPSLMLCELLGEKGIQMLKNLFLKTDLGKNGDIAMTLVMIAGLLAGGAGLAKIGSNLARKSAVTNARKAGRHNRTPEGREYRNKFKKISGTADNIYKAAAKADDIIGGAGLGHLTGAYSNKEVKNTNLNTNEVSNIDNYNHPKTDGEVIQKLLSGESVRLYHSHSSVEGVAESMMKKGMQPRRENESFFSTMPPVEGDTVNNTLYVDISDKKIFNATGKESSDIPKIQELIEQGYDGMIGESTSSLAISNLEVTMFKGEDLAGKLHKFQESAAIPRIHQQLEDIFKLNKLYGDQMDFSLAQQNIIFGNIRELINSGQELNSSNILKLTEELKSANISEVNINKIIKILEKQEGRLQISTQQVYKNAGLNDKGRISAAIDLLNVDNFSPAQKDALIKAHEVGGYDSGVFHYTKKERIEKVRILTKEGGFNSTQTQDLLDSGLAGQMNKSFDPVDFVYLNKKIAGDNEKIMSKSLYQLGFNNLEVGLLENIGIDITQNLHTDSIKVIDGAINNIADIVTGNVLLQILKKLPDNYIGEHLKGFQIRITNRLDNLPIAGDKSKEIIESNLGDKFISRVLENREFFMTQEYIKINKEFLTQVLNINMLDCDMILDSIKIEQEIGDNTTLNLLMNRLDKIRDIAKPKIEVIEYKSVDIELLHERIRFDTTKQRISEIEKRLGTSENMKLSDIQKKAIDRLNSIIEDAFEDYSIDDLLGEDIYNIINNVEGRNKILTDAGFSSNQIELLARNGIV